MSCLKNNKEVSQTYIDEAQEKTESSPFNRNRENLNWPLKRKIFLVLKVVDLKEQKLKFECAHPGCLKVYRSKENLILHVKNIHLKIKPYRCSFCELSFSHRNGKVYHERKIHIKFLPYKCQEDGCGSSFASKSALLYHVRRYHSKNRRLAKIKTRDNCDFTAVREKK